MPQATQFQPPVLYPLTLEYRVSDRLDGVTPNSPYLQPPGEDPALGEANKLIFNVERLGLIDLTGRSGAEGQVAGRFVNTTLIYGPVAPFASDTVAVAFDGVSQNVELSISAAGRGVYSRNCIFVPQTGQLRVNGLAASPGNPVIVRLSIWRPRDLEELTAIIEACCCLNTCVDSLGDPCFVRELT